MKKLLLFILLTFSLYSSAKEIENVQFTDLDGKSYDLYDVLDRGTYVYIYIVSTG